MIIQFASCDKNYVLGFLKTVYVNSKVTEQNLPKLISGLARDIVRVRDPQYHILALVPGYNYKESDYQELLEIVEEVEKLPEKRKETNPSK
jgi:transcriptional regulator of NAD metabolism